jgi:OHCU decarboxylase
LSTATPEDRSAATGAGGADPPDGALSVADLDALDSTRAHALLWELAGSRRWASLMVRARPYGSRDGLLTAADAAFDALDDDDWRDAFAAHSPIGAPRPGDARGAGEQAAGATATLAQRTALAAGNARYEARFGHVFLIRAAGRDAEEILEALQLRLTNDLETELRLAAGQQREITRLRLIRRIAR